jgi:ribA/ribD-fused uncharacterized protein
MNTITSFRGLYNWLSNFHIFSIQDEALKVTFNPKDFPKSNRKTPYTLPLNEYSSTSSEHIYMALKALYDAANDTAGNLMAETILERSAAEAKRMGKAFNPCEEDKLKLMSMALNYKFRANNELKQKLIKLKGTKLKEGNMWHDNFWGTCTCFKCEQIEGKNNLGNLLMQLSSSIET